MTTGIAARWLAWGQMSSSNLTDTIAAACDLKQQMNDHIDSLYSRLSEPAAFQRAKRDAGKVVAKQYAPAIRAIVDASTYDDLVERRDRLDTSLNKGWAYCYLHPRDREAYRAWEARLVEYMVINDCLDHLSIVTRTMDRIDRIEGFVEGAVHASV
jgi:hypothetical protein